MARAVSERLLSDVPAGAAGAGGVKFSLATQADDKDLRHLLRETPTPGGSLSIAFAREPDYFAGEGLMDADDHTIVARRGGGGSPNSHNSPDPNNFHNPHPRHPSPLPRLTGELVCMGRCSTRVVLLNGQPRRAGYLGELRMRTETPEAAKILRGGFQFFHDTAAPAPADFYFTSIAADNTRARRVLESGGGRLGLPAYHFLTELVTLVAPVKRTRAGILRRRKPTVATEAAAVPATVLPAVPEGNNDDAGELRRFLALHAPEGQGTLTWDETCWSAWLRCARTGAGEPDANAGKPGSDADGGFCVVRRAGRIVAAAALWDQRTFRQIVVQRYGKTLRWLRPGINTWAWAAGRPGLPREGAVLAQAAVFGLALADAGAWPELWRKLQEEAAARGLDWLTLATDARDARLALLRREAGAGGREYRTRLYEVRWPDLPSPARRLAPDGRPFRPEVALL
jgi:hypothetical protein